jgi:hypothetical protein
MYRWKLYTRRYIGIGLVKPNMGCIIQSEHFYAQLPSINIAVPTEQPMVGL